MNKPTARNGANTCTQPTLSSFPDRPNRPVGRPRPAVNGRQATEYKRQERTECKAWQIEPAQRGGQSAGEEPSGLCLT